MFLKNGPQSEIDRIERDHKMRIAARLFEDTDWSDYDVSVELGITERTARYWREAWRSWKATGRISTEDLPSRRSRKKKGTRA